jgi:hypothetical protein
MLHGYGWRMLKCGYMSSLSLQSVFSLPSLAPKPPKARSAKGLRAFSGPVFSDPSRNHSPNHAARFRRKGKTLPALPGCFTASR